MAGDEPITNDSKEKIPALFEGQLKAGEWMYSSKLSIATLMRPRYPLDVRVQACLMLHSWGYSSPELPVWQRRGALKSDRAVKQALSPYAIAKILGRAAEQHYEESASKDAPKPDTKISRQFMRNTLARMDDDGIIDRCRANCQLEKLVGCTYTQSREQGLVTPTRELSPQQRKKLGRQMVVYLLAKPRPAKAYDQGLVHKSVYEGPQVADPKGPKLALQLILPFVGDKEYASELAKRKDVKEEIAIYQQAREGLEAARQRLRLFLQQFKKTKAKRPAASQQPGLFPGDVSHADATTVLKKLREFTPADASAARELISACRAVDPLCSAVAIAEAVAVKAPLAKKNVVGFVLEAVPKMFVGGGSKAAGAPAKAEDYFERRARELAAERAAHG